MSIVIAGERSGVGKTTITLALLAALNRCGHHVQSFKVGPDYIDPMFHQYVTGRSCRNLDPVLTTEAYVQHCFGLHTKDVTHALVEGVMGLFDGASKDIQIAKILSQSNTPFLEESQIKWHDSADFGSTAHIARLLNLPVLLVVDCSRMSHSIAALVHGYRTFDPRIQQAGVILNRVGSDRHLDLLQSALDSINVPILGVLRRQDSITIPDRHLGLVPTAELANLNPLIEQLTHLGETCFDWSQLLPLLEVKPNGPDSPFEQQSKIQNPKSKIRLAIARDPAFSFYYADNLDLLEQLGAELIFWSPLTDDTLPDGIQGLYFGGGFPEMFAEQLAANKSAQNAVKKAIEAGVPTYAECGGLMYLCQQIVDFEARSFPMVAVLPTTAVMGKRLTLGYRQVKALQNGIMLKQGAIAWGHEFHRSRLTQESDTPAFEIGSQRSGVRGQESENRETRRPGDGKAGHRTTDNSSLIPHPSSLNQPFPLEGWHLPTIHASYIHLHWGAQPDIPKHFLECCGNYLLPKP